MLYSSLGKACRSKNIGAGTSPTTSAFYSVKLCISVIGSKPGEGVLAIETYRGFLSQTFKSDSNRWKTRNFTKKYGCHFHVSDKKTHCVNFYTFLLEMSTDLTSDLTFFCFFVICLKCNTVIQQIFLPKNTKMKCQKFQTPF